ncbi:MAG: c-type cytochrome [Sulfuricaulis sp.]
MIAARAVLLLWLVMAAGPAGAADDVMQRGEYLFRVAGCAVCHTDEKHHGAPLAGGRALKTSFGTFYTPNITPDRETGIGSWSEAEFVRALREGVDNEGNALYPAFPYTSYTQLTDADLHAIKIYLFSQKPVRQKNKAHDLSWYLRLRPLIKIWQMLYFTPGPFKPQSNESPTWNRGAYLATAVAHCGECHTPRNALGALRRSLPYAGTPDAVNGTIVPNITPDKPTGIGTWSQSDLAEYLDTGATPDGDYAGNIMATVIDDSLHYLTPGDRQAIAEYVMSLAPIQNEIIEKKNAKKTQSEEDYE